MEVYQVTYLIGHKGSLSIRQPISVLDLSRKGHVTYQNGLSIEWCTMKIELGNLIWYLMMKTRCYIGWFGLSVYQISLFGIEFTCVKGVWLLFTKAVSNC